MKKYLIVVGSSGPSKARENVYYERDCFIQVTCNQGYSGVGTAFPHLFALVTSLEDLDYIKTWLRSRRCASDTQICNASQKLRNLLHQILVEPDQNGMVHQLSMITQTLCTWGRKILSRGRQL